MLLVKWTLSTVSLYFIKAYGKSIKGNIMIPFTFRINQNFPNDGKGRSTCAFHHRNKKTDGPVQIMAFDTITMSEECAYQIYISKSVLSIIIFVYCKAEEAWLLY